MSQDSWFGNTKASRNEEEDALRQARKISGHQSPDDFDPEDFDLDEALDSDEDYDDDDFEDDYDEDEYDAPSRRDPNEVRLDSLYPESTPKAGKSWSAASGTPPPPLPPSAESGTSWWK